MVLRVCVVIPYFDNPRTISAVLRDVVLKTPFPVLVVDDGSETPVVNVLYSFEVKQALEKGRLRVARFPKNQGKGAALRHAINDLVSRGFTHMLTLDGDGRHLVSEAQKLLDLGRKHPWDMIMGNRGLKTEPKSRLGRWTRKLLAYCVRFETGSMLQDPRSGYRLYPLYPMQMMRFRTSHYDWEVEVLIRLLWSGVQVREVDIETAPFDPREHVQHYHKFWDSLRISTLNLLLLSVALMRSHNSPFELALSMGIGVFVGCIPALGFHTLIMILLAMFFPLNLVSMWIGNRISNPFLMPILILVEIYMGKNWLGLPAAEGIMGQFYQLAGGALLLGVMLGVPSAIATFLIARGIQNQEPDVVLASTQAGQHRILKWITKNLGLTAGYLAARIAAVWRYLWFVKARRGLNQYYRIQARGAGYWRRQALIVAHLRKCAEIQIDALALSAGTHPGLIVKSEGDLAASLQQKPEVITAHLGSWRSAASTLPGDEVRLNYADRPCAGDTELVLFFGKLAPFDVSSIRHAARAQTPVVYSFGVKTGERLYSLHASALHRFHFKPETALDLQYLAWLGRFVRQLEYFVRKHPEQWFNFFPFWSALPPSGQGLDHHFTEELQGSTSPSVHAAGVI